MSFQVLYSTSLVVREPISSQAPAVSSGQNEILHNGFNAGQQQLTASSTVPATIYSAQEVTLSGGSATIDLTALPIAGGATASGSGKKLQILRVQNPAGNGTVNVAPGGANPYAPFGASNDVDVPAGAELCLRLADTLADVSGTVKNILLTGTAGDVVNVELVLG